MFSVLYHVHPCQSKHKTFIIHDLIWHRLPVIDLVHIYHQVLVQLAWSLMMNQVLYIRHIRHILLILPIIIHQHLIHLLLNHKLPVMINIKHHSLLSILWILCLIDNMSLIYSNGYFVDDPITLFPSHICTFIINTFVHVISFSLHPLLACVSFCSLSLSLFNVFSLHFSSWIPACHFICPTKPHLVSMAHFEPHQWIV